MTRKAAPSRVRSFVGALAAIAGLGLGATPVATSSPAGPAAREFVAPTPATRRVKKPRRKLPPLHGFDPTFPITGDTVAGSCNTYRLGALSTFRLGELSGKDAEKMERAYCQSVHGLRTSRGSQAMMRARRGAP